MRIHRFIRPLVLALMLMSIPALSFGGVFVSVSIGPPPIPVYTQPLCPGAGYIWTPGYWAYGDDGYYWVPGTWVTAPEPGFLWTPGYWGWNEGAYLWHAGYWGPHVGFYGGINYGFGYTGNGFYGGEWRGRNFYYNRSVTNVNVTNVTNVYNKTVIVNNNNRVSYNGGNGGLHAAPNAQQRQWEHERHMEPTRMQNEHFQQAARNPQLLARNNGGRPAIAATDRPGQFNGRGVVGARAAGGPVNREALNVSPRNAPGRNEGRANNAPVNARSNEGTARGNNVPRPPSANNERGAGTANASPRNVPRPNNAPRAEANTPRENNAGARNVPRPSPTSRENNVRSENNARTSAPPERNVATPHNAPPARENTSRSYNQPSHQQAPRSAAPARESAPRNVAPSHESAPRPSAAHEAPRGGSQGQHAEAPRGGGEKPHR